MMVFSRPMYIQTEECHHFCFVNFKLVDNKPWHFSFPFLYSLSSLFLKVSHRTRWAYNQTETHKKLYSSSMRLIRAFLILTSHTLYDKIMFPFNSSQIQLNFLIFFCSSQRHPLRTTDNVSENLSNLTSNKKGSN